MFMLLLLLANDRALLGPRRNALWQNLFAAATTAFIAALSLLAALRTVLPGVHLHINNLTLPALAAAVTALAMVIHAAVHRTVPDPATERLTPQERRTWTAPPLDRLDAPPATTLRTVVLTAAAGYVAVVVVLLACAAASASW